MSNTFQPGTKIKIVRPTFLFQGIIILQNTRGTIKSVEGDEFVVDLLDREGNHIDVPGFKPEHLELVE